MSDTPSLRLRAAAVTATAALLGTVTACSGDPASTAPTAPASAPASAKEVRVAGTVVSTAGSANEAEVVVPDPIRTAWAGLGAKGSGLEWVGVAGDGSTTTAPADLTGDSTAQTQALLDRINAFDAEAPGRSALAGLAAVKSPAKAPVWVFSPLLDTKEPLDFAQLAFDESPNSVVRAVRKAGALPKLTGREVTFVVTPVAGDQEKLSKLQVGYQHAVWEGLAKAGGAKKVTFFDGTGTTPGAGTIPAIPVPDPNDKIDAQQEGRTRTCTLPSPALFVADQAALIDKKATLRALKECVGTVDNSTRITVEGHTAGAAGANNAFAKDLSTRRATEVAALLKELDVPAGNIEKVVGYGSSKPLVQPPSNPKNRAVVVTFTSTG